jgi:hypothetical protein
MAQYHLNTRDPGARAMIIDKYHKHGGDWVWRKYGVAARTVRDWIILKRGTGSLKSRFEEGGRDYKLTLREMKRLEQKLLDDPFATNEELATAVHDKITPRSAGNYIKNSAHGFQWKLEQEDIEASFSQKNADEGKEFMKKLKNIPLDKRIYVDETQISSGIRRRKGRFPQGVKPWTPRNRFYPRQTIIGAIKKKRWLIRGTLYNHSPMTTEEFENWVENELAPLVNRGDYVFWDRWGRSGRAKKPVAGHLSPKAKRIIEARGAHVVLLPPTGKLFDPIEMIFGDTKYFFEKKLGKIMLKTVPSKVPLETKERLWLEAADLVQPNSFERAYKERANGKEFLRVCQEKGL